MPLQRPLILLCLSLSLAHASPVSWGDDNTLFSTEHSSDKSYDFSAWRVSGRLVALAPLPYSLSFKRGTVTVGGRSVEPGCFSGKRSENAVLAFDRAWFVQFHVPPTPLCPSLIMSSNMRSERSSSAGHYHTAHDCS